MDFRILGPVEVRNEERRVPIGGPKPRALLGVLLVHAGEVVSTARLVDELWGERPPVTAEKLVAGYVHALRGALGRNTIATQMPGYRIDVDRHTLDLLEFQRLVGDARAAPPEDGVELRRRALALWRGPPLANVLLEGSARHEIGRLIELRLATQIESIDIELELGRQARLIGELEALVAAHPYQERLHAQLMLALYRSQRQAEALEVYRALRARLSDELGLEPGESLRQLESAILRQDPALAAQPRDASPPQVSAEPNAMPPDGERRPVTVLFADLVGSTALGQRLPPDEVKTLIGECVTQMSKAVEEYRGTVQSDEGDGICAYFGVPQPHEDDPERAARAGLRILEVVGDYARDIAAAWRIPDFAVRIVINTDRVGVGSMRAENSQTVVLGAVNIAARIRAAADPGTIVVDEETARRLAHRFTFEPLARIDVNGHAAPVAVKRLAGPRRPDRVRRSRPLIGRESAVKRLEQVARDLQAGRGQAVVVVGDAGIGKTRLVAELRTLVGETVEWLEGHCLSYGGLPYFPFVEILQRWLGVAIGDAEVVVRTRARARLVPLLVSSETEVLPGLARLLQIPLAPGIATSASAYLSADEMRRAYVAWIEALAAERPLVLALEDLHWADARILDLAGDLLELTDGLPLLVVATLRRDPSADGWRFRTRVMADFSHRAIELPLTPLSPDETRRLLATLLPGALDEEAREAIVTRAEGNPLYIEELLRALLEIGGLEQRHRTWTTTLKPSLLLPPALENLLVARIDRLPDGPRRLAQIAAAIGREFPVTALERVAGNGAGDDLGELLRAGIVREERRYPELWCAFRHGLLQEAALSTLTPATRRELYDRVAGVYEELYASSSGEHAA